MKRYGNLWPTLISFEHLLRASERAKRGKRFRPAVARFEFNLERELFTLQALRHKTYRPGNYRSFYIYEPKKRLISAATRLVSRILRMSGKLVIGHFPIVVRFSRMLTSGHLPDLRSTVTSPASSKAAKAR